MTKVVKIDQRMLNAVNQFIDFPGHSLDSIEEAAEFLMLSISSRVRRDDHVKKFSLKFALGYTKAKAGDEEIISVEYLVKKIEALKQICELLLNGEKGIDFAESLDFIGEKQKGEEP